MGKEYNISRAAGECVKCRRALAENEEFTAVVVEKGEDLERQDWCLACWEAGDRGDVGGLFGQWRTRVPARQAKRKLFVDDALLVNFFQRLEGAAEPARLNFRFVLALVLMRKKLLVYERSAKDDAGNETWHMRLRGTDESHEVANPRLDEERITEVSLQLSEILQGEL
jgi:hypothetical protein